MPASRIPYAYYCGVPNASCCGSVTPTNNGIRSKEAIKTHPQPEQAFACMRRHLINDLGYKQIGGRDFMPPDGGPVRVLTKQSRFGQQLRPGKEGTRNMVPTKRGCKGGMVTIL